jgi:hydrogenase maturation protease
MVIIGLGSPCLSDDSVGPRVVRELSREGCPGARLVEAHASGLPLMDELAEMRRAIIIDALLDDSRNPGEIVVSTLRESGSSFAGSHYCSLAEALSLGRSLGITLPAESDIILVGVVAKDVATFGESLSPEVEAALPRTCRVVRSLAAGAETDFY